MKRIELVCPVCKKEINYLYEMDFGKGSVRLKMYDCLPCNKFWAEVLKGKKIIGREHRGQVFVKMGKETMKEFKNWYKDEVRGT